MNYEEFFKECRKRGTTYLELKNAVMKKLSDKTKTGAAERQAKFRDEQKKLGRRGRLYYLTDAEKEALDSFLHELRESR